MRRILDIIEGFFDGKKIELVRFEGLIANKGRRSRKRMKKKIGNYERRKR
jgi:hypothetical protein